MLQNASFHYDRVLAAYLSFQCSSELKLQIWGGTIEHFLHTFLSELGEHLTDELALIYLNHLT